MAVEIRTVSDDEVPAYRHCLMQVFGDDVESDPDGDRRMCALIPATQRWAAFDGSQIVATAGTFDHAIGGPGWRHAADGRPDDGDGFARRIAARASCAS
jgi:hypothetical protein